MAVMGRVASAFGIRGWVKIQPFSEYVDSLMDYDTWFLGRENGPWREVEVGQCEVHGKTLVAQFSDCDDRNLAEKLKGLLVAVPRSSLPEEEEGEYYWADLIGMSVVNEAGESLGTVAELLETGANDILVVRGSGKDVLIPFLEDVIKQVDLAEKRIQVDWLADY
ncbi:MAG: ribosome maturation factor RimM [Gallionella sp.]|nr:ribosome maturation factor RimM [Gallionella sp.]MDD4947298.1 ribosome maturation factor RimM [Gallionella sp.]MDD5611970.1 ribosome maturation factor RimM [Gallionella sp.]